MRKRLSVFFALVAMFATISGMIIFSGSSLSVNKTFAVGQNNGDMSLSCESAYLMDDLSHTVMYAKNENVRRTIASMCKIMTLNICFDEIRAGHFAFNDIVTVSGNAAGMGGSQVFLGEGNQCKVGELMKSIAIASANDSSVAMAEFISGSENAFVERMNAKAKELGMQDTVFVNCTGLPKAGQYSTAHDVALMTSALIKNPEYFGFSRIWTENFKHSDGRETVMTNTNKLVRFYDGCDGGKTGFTSESGFCISATAMRGGMRLVGVVIHAPSSKERFKDASSLFNYGFANYASKIIVDDRKPLDLSVKIENANKDTVEVIAEKPLALISKKNQKIAVETVFEPAEKVKAPVKKGEVVGKITVFSDGVEIASVNVLANEDVNAKTYFDIIKGITGNWLLIG